MVSRVWRSKQQARVTYDRLSRWYDISEGIFERKLRRAGVRLVKARPGERVLEVGPGTGASLLALAHSVGGTGHVFGLDISEGMLSVTRKRIHKARLGDKVGLVCADAVKMPLKQECCDAIFMSFVLELFDTPEIMPVLRECHRVLRPGGRICVVALAKTARPTVSSTAYEWAHNTWPTVVDCRPILVRGSLLEAGFSVTRGSRHSLWGLPVDIVLAGKA